MQRNISLRASPVLLARIERLAAARGSSRSAAIRTAVVEASMPVAGAPVPDEGEVLALLGQAARGGSVAAMRS